MSTTQGPDHAEPGADLLQLLARLRGPAPEAATRTRLSERFGAVVTGGTVPRSESRGLPTFTQRFAAGTLALTIAGGGLAVVASDEVAAFAGNVGSITANAVVNLVPSGAGGGSAALSSDATPDASPSTTETSRPSATSSPEATSSPSASATPSPSTSPSTTSTPDPSPASTTAPPTNGTSPFAAGAAGTVTLSANGTTLTVAAVEPAAGWVPEIEVATGREVEVDFRRNGERIKFNAELEDGEIRVRVETEGAAPQSSATEPTSGDDDDNSSSGSGSGNSGPGSENSGSGSGSGSSGSGREEED